MATFLVCGLAVYAGTFLLMRRLGVSPAVAFALATWMATSPAFVAYENWLFYSLPVAALLLGAVLLFEHAVRSGRLRDGIAFGAVLFVLCATRSLYHLAYLLAGMAWLALAWRRPRRAIAAAVAPVLLLAALYGKNAVLFGHFAASTWTGMNLARLTTEALAPGDATALVAEGTLHAVSRVPAFSRPHEYPRDYFDRATPSRVRALSWEHKTTGAANFNHAAFLAISQDYLRDAGWVLRHRPGVYAGSVRRAWEIYFRSPSDLRFLGIANIAALRPGMDVYDRVFFGRAGPAAPDGAGAPRYWLLAAGLVIGFGYGMATALGRGRAGRALTRDQRLVVGLMCFNVAYVALVGNLLELGENNRFRVETDALSVCLLGLLVDRALLSRWRGRSIPA